MHNRYVYTLCVFTFDMERSNVDTRVHRYAIIQVENSCIPCSNDNQQKSVNAPKLNYCHILWCY